MRDGPSSTAVWPYGLFVLSGLAGLLFETVYLRQLAWLFGNSATATALVLSAFMAGLALGAALFGAIADRLPRPLALYGFLELGVATSGAALVWLLGSGRQLFMAPLRAIEPGWGRSLAELALAFVLVLIPTVFMGGTLPTLGRFLIRDLESFTRPLGLLYAANTLGAAAGALLAGFYSFELLGVSRSGYAAAGLMTLVGVAALALDRFAGHGPGTDRVGARARARESSPLGPAKPAVRSASLIAAGAAGLAVLGYEVAWTRLLGLFMRSFSYSFSLMLALFLFGLSLGAVLVSATARRWSNPCRSLGWLQLAMGGYVAFSVLWLPDQLVPVEAGSFTAFLLRATARGAWIVLPPTILSGVSLPLAASCFARREDEIGTDVGVIYGVNTLGAIVGALLTGLVLLPTIGAPNSLVALALMQAVAGIGVLLLTGARAPSFVVAVLLTLACAVPAFTGMQDRFVDAFLRANRGSGSIRQLLFFHEGATDTVAIVRRDYGFRDPQAKSLITNGVSMTATVKPVWRYMALEGHLPLLFAPHAASVLALGVGTGITLGAVASRPELETIVAVELSDGVVAGLEHFAAESGAAFRDPRVTLLRADGRHHLELTEQRYDAITLEPPPPIVAGSVHLYTLDFYELCRRRLNPGGVLAQWLPLHAQSLESARMVARTFAEAFPHAMLWLPSVRDAVLLGSAEPLVLETSKLRDAWKNPRTRANLERALLETPESLLGTFLLERPGILAWAGEAPVITDERPLMEFFRHQGGNMRDADIASLISIPQAGWDWLEGADPGLVQALERENRALRAHVRSIVERRPADAERAALMSRSTEYFLYTFGCTTQQLARVEAGRSELPKAAVPEHLQRCRWLRQGRASNDGD